MLKNETIDTVKIIMCLLVISIHAGIGEGFTGYVLQQGVARIAVPFFFIASGFFYFSTLKKEKHFVWMRRIFILYIVWMLLYDPELIEKTAYFLKNIILLDGGGKDFSFLKFWFFGWHHLWFFPALLMAAAITCLFKRVDGRFVLCGAFLLYALGIVFQYADNIGIELLGGSFNSLRSYRNGLFMGFPLFYAGYYIAAKNLMRHCCEAFSMEVFSFLLCAVILEATVGYILHGKSADVMVTPPLLAVATFCLCFKKPGINIFGPNVRYYTLGLYLIHAFVTKKMSFLPKDSELDFFLAVSFSVLVCFIVIRTPFKKLIS